MLSHLAVMRTVVKSEVEWNQAAPLTEREDPAHSSCAVWAPSKNSLSVGLFGLEDADVVIGSVMGCLRVRMANSVIVIFGGFFF